MTQFKTNYWLLVAGYGLLAALILTLPAQSQANKPEVILTWSTNSYAPANYSGKAMPSAQSTIEVTADIIPKTIETKNLYFRWFLDEHFQEANSGLGRDIFRFTAPETTGDTYSIRLEVINQDKSLLASAYQSIKIIDPEIVLETKITPLNSSTLALKKYQISANQEIKFISQPYFFNIKGINELDFSWDFGGQEASQISDQKPNVFILTISQLTKVIKQDLRVLVENKNNPLQKSQTIAEIILTP